MYDLPARYKLDGRENEEGLAIRVANGYRIKRPNKRPKKSRGHGLKITFQEKLRKKRPEAQAIFTRPPAVKVTVPVASFLAKLLAKRPESWSMRDEHTR